MANKIIGYVLIGVGLLLIVMAVISVVSVFRHTSEPIHVFSAETFAVKSTANKEAFDIQQMVGLNPETISFSFNIFMHLILMGFILNAGARMAGIGAQLVRPIIVETPKSEVKKVPLK